jgi:nitrite reductase (NADH) small subunit
MGEFIEVAYINEIPENGSKVVYYNGEKVALFNLNGDIHAIQNTCPHAGGPLGEGSLEESIITCPWHGWQFDVKDGVSPVNPNAKVAKFNVLIDGDKIKISK